MGKWLSSSFRQIISYGNGARPGFRPRDRLEVLAIRCRIKFKRGNSIITGIASTCIAKMKIIIV
jgi:hypothetical protein